MNYLVLNVRSWKLTDDATREAREGLTVTYLDLDSAPSEGEVGIAPLNISADKKLLSSFTSAPALYELSFTQRRGAKGKPQLVLNGATLQKTIKLSSVPGGTQ